jgi:methionine sulfoxide reductase heme-binding subunit
MPAVSPGAEFLAAGSGPSPLWYATRATGVVALILLTLSVAFGVAGAARYSAPALPRLIRSGLHRNISLLAVVFVGAHVITTVLDSYTSISLVNAFVPFTSTYRSLWLGLGAIALDLLLAIVITSLLRSRLSHRTWRSVHWLAYVSWPIALWHGLGTGTDTRLSWLLAVEAACLVAVAATVWWRLRLARPGSLRSAGLAATAALAVATIVFTAVGPLQPGWSRTAGTPQASTGRAHVTDPGARR